MLEETAEDYSPISLIRLYPDSSNEEIPITIYIDSNNIIQCKISSSNSFIPFSPLLPLVYPLHNSSDSRWLSLSMSVDDKRNQLITLLQNERKLGIEEESMIPSLIHKCNYHLQGYELDRLSKYLLNMMEYERFVKLDDLFMELRGTITHEFNNLEECAPFAEVFKMINSKENLDDVMSFIRGVQ